MVKATMNTRAIGAYRAALRADPCAYCSGAGGTLDHIDAQRGGGRDTWDNLTGACARCNAGKSDRTLLGRLGRLKQRATEPPTIAQMVREILDADASLILDVWDRACAIAWGEVGR